MEKFLTGSLITLLGVIAVIFILKLYRWFVEKRWISFLINKQDVQWVVNDYAELGVKIGRKFFWLYKGESFTYFSGKHEDGSDIKYRQVGKREFGECCYPIHLEQLPKPYYFEGENWQSINSKNL